MPQKGDIPPTRADCSGSSPTLCSAKLDRGFHHLQRLARAGSLIQVLSDPCQGPVQSDLNGIRFQFEQGGDLPGREIRAVPQGDQVL